VQKEKIYLTMTPLCPSENYGAMFLKHHSGYFAENGWDGAGEGAKVEGGRSVGMM
jgi:hypothetical protein